MQTKLIDELSHLVSNRFDSNKNKSMMDVYMTDESFVQFEKVNLEFMFNNRAEIIRLLEDQDMVQHLINLFVKRSMEFTYQNNQFIQLNKPEQERLRNIYKSYLVGMRDVLDANPQFPSFSENFTTLVKDHFVDLKNNISRFFDSEIGWQVQENIILKQVVCCEYTPEFQLSFLGLDLGSLKEPILDLGCGKHGALVNYLRMNGKTAIGTDRLVDDNPYLKEADWFDLSFEKNTWGTIISNIAFSNHFAFHHQYKHGTPRQYATQYMQILYSLKPGGVFTYSPRLPFIEQYLPDDQFTVQSFPAPTRTILECSQEDEQFISAGITKIKKQQPSNS